MDEFETDTLEIIKDGHSHICFLTGDGALTYRQPDKLIPYLEILNSMDELKEIILNVTSQDTNIFKSWREAVPDKAMQFRIFQETYDKDIYKLKHPSDPKADYSFRKEAQFRAMQAGFDNYGLGVLLGLNPYFLQEIEAISQHSTELFSECNKHPARICLPSANELAGIGNVEKQHHVSEKAMILSYALMKLAVPESSVVSSERDRPELLEKLDLYASNRTVDVQPSVGGNVAQLEHGDTLLKQSSVFPVNVLDAAEDYEERGYDLKFDY